MYEIIVSNVGTVYKGDDEKEANKTYDEYEKLSRASVGRFRGEIVRFVMQGETSREYLPLNR